MIRNYKDFVRIYYYFFFQSRIYGSYPRCHVIHEWTKSEPSSHWEGWTLSWSGLENSQVRILKLQGPNHRLLYYTQNVFSHLKHSIVGDFWTSPHCTIKCIFIHNTKHHNNYALFFLSFATVLVTAYLNL